MTINLDDLTIYVADAGSVSKGNFHWVTSTDLSVSSTDPLALAKAVATGIANNEIVALGYESPLFVPLPGESDQLGKARDGEVEKAIGSKPFNAGAGASVFATGIQSLAWVLKEVKKLSPCAVGSTRWKDFQNKKCSLFLWEAFVTGSEKAYPPSHAGDAALAIKGFRKSLHLPNPTRIRCERAFSLGAAALIQAGLTDDLNLLNEPCVVVRPIFSDSESKQRLKSYKRRTSEKKEKKEHSKNAKMNEAIEARLKEMAN